MTTLIDIRTHDGKFQSQALVCHRVTLKYRTARHFDAFGNNCETLEILMTHRREAWDGKKLKFERVTAGPRSDFRRDISAAIMRLVDRNDAIDSRFPIFWQAELYDFIAECHCAVAAALSH